MIQSLSSGLDGVCSVFIGGLRCVLSNFSPKVHFLPQKMDSYKHKTGFNLVLGCLVYPTMHDTIIIKWFGWGLRCVFGGLRCILRVFFTKSTLFTQKMDSCKHKTGLILY